MSEATGGVGCSAGPVAVTSATGDGPSQTFQIRGMDCAEEVAILKRALSPLVPETALGFDVLRGRVEVRGDVKASQVQALVAKTGMRAELWKEQPDRPVT